MPTLKSEITRVLYQRVPPSFIVSSIVCVGFTLLDYSVTNIVSGGDFSMEGNTLARWGWELLGPLGPYRFIEVPVWLVLISVVAGTVHSRSSFLALLWLNFLTVQHLFGFMTWLPFTPLNFLYVQPPFAVTYAISLISIAICIPVTIIQKYLLRYTP